MTGPGVGGSKARTEPHTPEAGHRSDPSPGPRLSPSPGTQAGQRGDIISFPTNGPKAGRELALSPAPCSCSVERATAVEN